MSKTEKSVLIRKIASELGEELSEDQLNNAMRIISSSINQYEVEPSAGALYSIDNNELIGAYLSAKETKAGRRRRSSGTGTASTGWSTPCRCRFPR